jgi:hypothetical protein
MWNEVLDGAPLVAEMKSIAAKARKAPKSAVPTRSPFAGGATVAQMAAPEASDAGRSAASARACSRGEQDERDVIAYGRDPRAAENGAKTGRASATM